VNTWGEKFECGSQDSDIGADWGWNNERSDKIKGKLIHKLDRGSMGVTHLIGKNDAAVHHEGNLSLAREHKKS